MMAYGSLAASTYDTIDRAIPTPQATRSNRDIVSDFEHAYYRRCPIQLKPLTRAQLDDLNERAAQLARPVRATTTPDTPARPHIETAAVVRLHRSGHTTAQIATQLGCTDNTVRRHLNKAGETRRRQGSSLDQASIDAIVDLHQAGHTTAQITHQLGCTRITIHKYLDQHGFPHRESRAPRASVPGPLLSSNRLRAPNQAPKAVSNEHAIA
jgi:predicted transcriptional regulator